MRSFRTYKESDSPGIAKQVRKLEVLDKPGATSGSYEAFQSIVTGI